MMTTVEGVVRGGKIELVEAAEAAEGSRVLVTFLPFHSVVDLPALGISKDQAAEIRARFGTLAAEDWCRPEMDVYDEL